jgi:hypothetical protein
VWYRIPADNHTWKFQLSTTERFLLQIFHPRDRFNPSYWDLIDKTPLVPPNPLIFYASNVDLLQNPILNYYLRVSVADSEPFPSVFTLNYGRDISHVPVPDPPELAEIPVGWKEDLFQEISAFWRNSCDLIRANMGDLKVVYDMGRGAANARMAYSPLHRYYCTRLYREWIGQHGVSVTCGFSSSDSGKGIGYMIALFNEYGLPLPGSYALNTYGNEYESLKNAYQGLKAAGGGEQNKKVRILETFYNDPQVTADVRRGLRETGVNFGGILQWPLSRGDDPKTDPYFADAYPYRFNQYFYL